MKLFLICALLLSAMDCIAQSSSTATISRSTGHGKPKKFDLEFLLASQQTKDIISHSINGTYSNFDASLLQSINSNNEVRYYLSSRYLTADNVESEFDWFFTEFMYRRKNILNQSEHGVYLEAEFKNLYYLDPEVREMYGINGATIPQLIFQRRIKGKGSVELKLRRHINHTNNNSSYTVDFEDRVYLSGAWMFEHRYMFNTMLKYQHKVRKDEGLDFRFMDLVQMVETPYYTYPDFSRVPIAKKNQELVTIHPGFFYFISRKSLIEFYVETTLSNTYDKRDLETIAKDEFVFGTALYLSAF